ncbi:MAG TPA: histidine kinase dimerization/phospho-acceptor domain-containing protein [Isosphaeraceae bacterium]|jgi:signal transduction histidine kinase|nr:histidine kinase dimerization/phospho-acceptor domain-containing protein [Isosphaeraceae bacterium]
MATTLPPRFLSLVVHDLRTPLNVIGLTTSILEPMAGANPELGEEVGIIRENVAQIERMLAHLSDFCRLGDDAIALSAEPFDPRRLAEEVIDEVASKAPSRPRPRVEHRPGCPDRVVLDPSRARQALKHALANALAAAADDPVRVELDGRDGRWLTRVVVDRPPPATVRSTPLRPDGVERLFGTPQDRLGLELAIVARISELLGGTAGLDAAAGRTAIVLDWPTHLQPTMDPHR